MGDSTRRLPILDVDPADVASAALVVGDPARAERAATRLSDVSRVGRNREYQTFTGELEGRRVTVCSHGVGSAGAAICFEELARAGVETLIRVGTCGALQDGIADGDVVVPTGAVRDDGASSRLVPLGYPAVVDARLCLALQAAAREVGPAVHQGVVLTSDLLYPSAVLGADFEVWQKSRAIAIEMELATMLVIAGLHGQRAAGILAVDGNPTLGAQDMGEYDPHRAVVQESIDAILGIALDVLRSSTD